MCRYWYCWDCAGVDDPSVGIEDDTSPCLLVTWERPRCCTMCNDGDAPWREISAAEYAAYLREMDGTADREYEESLMEWMKQEGAE